MDENISAEQPSGIWIRCPEARDAPICALGKFPLIVMSHGNCGDRMNSAWLAEVLAANGYIVAAMDHYGNTWNNQIDEHFLKLWERPKDVSFVIDQLLQDSNFGCYIDKGKIGFAGFSLGGHTGVWLAGGKVNGFDQSFLSGIPAGQLPDTITPEFVETIDFSPVKESYKDKRLSAFFLMAPALIYFFDPDSFQAIQDPVYIIAPEGDDLIPYEKNAKLLSSQIQHSSFQLIPGPVNHYIFLNELTKTGKYVLKHPSTRDPPSVDRKKIHADVALSAVQFFDSHLK